MPLYLINTKDVITSKTFSQKSEIKRHQLIVLIPVIFLKKHSVECPILQNTSLYIVAIALMPVMFVKTLSRMSHITKHQLIHSGQCPYACNVCKNIQLEV
jgi:acid stress-induced BolA-like protein IbaG/YrbA